MSDDRAEEFERLVTQAVCGDADAATRLRALPAFKAAKVQHRKGASDRVVRHLLQRAMNEE